MISAEILHFVRPEPFVKIVPDHLPNPVFLVYLSGFFEVLGGIGLLIPALQSLAAWGLVALLIAVFPANIKMATQNIQTGASTIPQWALWLRLPMQGVLIAWAAWFTSSGRK